MKTKSLIIASLIGLTIISGIVLKNSFINTNQTNINNKGQAISDAIKYSQTLKADLNTGEINPEYVLKARKDLSLMKQYRSSLNLDWEIKGPDNIGGRTRTLVIDKDNTKILYTGGVSGGFYKSINGGQSWQRKEYEANLGGLVISSIAQASDGTLYFGTGELYFNLMSGSGGNMRSGSMGGGIYKSTDKGETWDFLNSTDASKPGNTEWENIQDIVCGNGDVVYAGSSQGLMKSTDGGDNWTRLALPDGYSSAVIFDIEKNGNTMFVAAYRSHRCKIYKSTDEENFSLVGDGIISTNQARVSITISQSNPDYVYVVGASNGAGGYQTYAMEGIYKSTDNGENWVKIVNGNSEAEVFGRFGHYQGQYDQCIAVDPTDENRIFVGGVDMYTLNDGMWYKSASTSEFNDNDKKIKNPYYVHADKHNIFFDTKSTPNKMYIVTDGGIYFSTNFTNKYPTYGSLNVNYITTQFYAVAAHTDGSIIGGTQDNGSIRIEKDGLTGISGKEILGGDGFYTEISKYNSSVCFYESQYGDINRSQNKGKDDDNDFMDDIDIMTSHYNFNTPFRLWEDTIHYDTFGTSYDTTVFYSKFFVAAYDNNVNKNGVWMTENATDFKIDTIKWFHISEGMGGFEPQCLEYTPDGNTIFIGGNVGSTGRLYRITGIKGVKYEFDAGGNFDPTAKGITTELVGSWSNRTVTGLGISPSYPNTVVATLGNYVSSSYDHVYLSNNALDSASKVSFVSIQGNLPYFPVYDAAINSFTTNQDTIIIATDYGIFATVNGGNTWSEENNGMDRSPVYMLRQVLYQYSWGAEYMFYAATHGMGIYGTQTLAPDIGVNKNIYISKATMTVYPNPAINHTNLIIKSDKVQNVKTYIYNINGQIVKSFNIKLSNTENNIRINTSSLRKGTYIVKTVGENIDLTSKFIVIK